MIQSSVLQANYRNSLNISANLNSAFSVIFLLLAALHYSCKDESDKKQEFRVLMEVATEIDTRIELYYKGSDEKFGPDRKLTRRTTGGNESNPVSFELPPGLFPSALRIDFGDNSNLANARISKVQLEFGGNRIDMDAYAFGTFFSCNEYVSYNGETGVLGLKSVNGKYDPFFISKPIMEHRLKIAQKGIWLKPGR